MKCQRLFLFIFGCFLIVGCASMNQIQPGEVFIAKKYPFQSVSSLTIKSYIANTPTLYARVSHFLQQHPYTLMKPNDLWDKRFARLTPHNFENRETLAQMASASPGDAILVYWEQAYEPPKEHKEPPYMPLKNVTVEFVMKGNASAISPAVSGSGSDQTQRASSDAPPDAVFRLTAGLGGTEGRNPRIVVDELKSEYPPIGDTIHLATSVHFLLLDHNGHRLFETICPAQAEIANLPEYATIPYEKKIRIAKMRMSKVIYDCFAYKFLEIPQKSI